MKKYGELPCLAAPPSRQPGWGKTAGAAGGQTQDGIISARNVLSHYLTFENTNLFHYPSVVVDVLFASPTAKSCVSIFCTGARRGSCV